MDQLGIDGKAFPRKEVYVYTALAPIPDRKVLALNDSPINLEPNFKRYADRKWALENTGWTSSPISSVVSVEYKDGSLRLHSGLTEYKYLLGMVKLAIERKRTDLTSPSGLSTEIMPLTADGIFLLSRRSPQTTQHGAGFYDIPTAGQSAQIWIDKLPKEHSGLVKCVFDVSGFSRWNLIRHLGLKIAEIGDIFYTGFSKGFEVSIDAQFNGYARVGPEAQELMKRLELEGRSEMLAYRFENLPEVLDSIGRKENLKEDIFGNKPIPKEDGFRIVDDCLGTLLSNTFHIKGRQAYIEAKRVLEKRGYRVLEVPESGKTIRLEDLN